MEEEVPALGNAEKETKVLGVWHSVERESTNENRNSKKEHRIDSEITRLKVAGRNVARKKKVCSSLTAPKIAWGASYNRWPPKTVARWKISVERMMCGTLWPGRSRALDRAGKLKLSQWQDPVFLQAWQVL